MNKLCVRAGEQVYQIIQDGQLSFDDITTYIGTAAGPRWLLATGFDRAILKGNVLGDKRPVILAGSSVGAMRLAAWMQPEPEKSYEKLIEAYIAMHVTKKDTPETIMRSIRTVIDSYVDDDALPFALSNKRYRLAIITARAKRLAASNVRWLQRLGLGTAFVCNALSRNSIHQFFQRVVFHNSPLLPYFCLNHDFRGQAIPLNEANFKPALLASAATPLLCTGVRDIYGAPRGMYRDGGLTDYHLNQRYSGSGSVTLLFNHQRSLVPTVMDKPTPSRQPSRDYLGNILLVYPSNDFIRLLPYEHLPDRDDFKKYADNPMKRIRSWKRAATVSEHLGDEFLELVESGKLREVTERL